MNLQEAFQEQLKTVRLITEDDLNDELNQLPAIWQSVLVDLPDGNKYSSGREIAVGDKLLIAYVIQNKSRPAELLLEASEIESYESKFKVVRLVNSIPVLTTIEEDAYQLHDWQHEI